MAQFPLLSHCASRSHTPGPKRAYRQPPTTPTSTATAAPRRTQDLIRMTLSLVVGSRRSPPSGKATRPWRERRRPQAGGEVTRRLGVHPASGKGFGTTSQEPWSREGDSNPWPAHYE